MIAHRKIWVTVGKAIIHTALLLSHKNRCFSQLRNLIILIYLESSVNTSIWIFAYHNFPKHTEIIIHQSGKCTVPFLGYLLVNEISAYYWLSSRISEKLWKPVRLIFQSNLHVMITNLQKRSSNLEDKIY